PAANGTKGNTAYWHKSGEFYKYQMDFPKANPLPIEDQIKSKKAYYACVSYVDAQIGRVLDSLNKLELADNTIVVLWGDHGWNLGDHGIWGKHSALEYALKSPLLIRVPGMKTAGKKTEAVAETIDIYPTLRDLCQTTFNETSHELNGVSIRPVLENASHPGKNASISYWQGARSVRSGQYRLMAKKKGEKFQNIELYDHASDPEETTNITALNPEVTQRLLQLIKEDAPVLLNQ
ncbi:iduronate sulfatase, partial [bacterium M21]